MLNNTFSHSKFKPTIQSKAILGSNSLLYSAEIAFKNKFRSLMKEILKKIEEYKGEKNNNTFDENQLKNFLAKKISSKKGEYYDFLNEEDSLLLKILIQFLYEELEKALFISKKKQYENMNQIKNLKKIINDYEKLKLSPEPLIGTKRNDNDQAASYKNLKLCLEKISQFNELFRNLKANIWQILNDEIEFEKVLFQNEQIKHDFTANLEEIYDKVNKTLDNNIIFLQSFSVFDYNEDERSFDEGKIGSKPINYLQTNSGLNVYSPLKNISNSSNDYNKDKIIEKLERENEVLKQQLEIKIPLKNNESFRKDYYNEDFKNLKEENWNLKLKMEELRKEFGRISSNVVNSMNERDIHSKQLMNENEQLMRRKNLNNIDFQSLEHNYQNKIKELRSELSNTQEKILKLLEEKQDLIKEIKELKLTDKQNNYSMKSSSIKMEQLNGILNETQKEMEKWKSQYNLLCEKLDGMQKEKLKTASAHDLKIYEKNIDSLVKENQELVQILEKFKKEKHEIEKENKELIEKNSKIMNNSNSDNNSSANFNNLTEIQLLSNMILLFSKYKNNELEEKNRLIIEKYLKETQKDYFQRMENSINEYKKKCYIYLEDLKFKISGTMILYQDIKWLLGVLEENKSMLSNINSKNYEEIVNSICEDNSLKSGTINNKIIEWNKDHNKLKDELDIITEDLAQYDILVKEKLIKDSADTNKLNDNMEELRMIINSLSSENRDLKTSVNKMNQEMKNASSVNQKYIKEINSLKNPTDEPNEENNILFSYESFGQSPENKKSKTQNEEDQNKYTQLCLIHMQAYALEQMLLYSSPEEEIL